MNPKTSKVDRTLRRQRLGGKRKAQAKSKVKNQLPRAVIPGLLLGLLGMVVTATTLVGKWMTALFFIGPALGLLAGIMIVVAYFYDEQLQKGIIVSMTFFLIGIIGGIATYMYPSGVRFDAEVVVNGTNVQVLQTEYPAAYSLTFACCALGVLSTCIPRFRKTQYVKPKTETSA
jgi:hypothetical protein